MTITIISLLILLLFPLIPAQAQTDASLQSKDTLLMEEFACSAIDPATLKKCINEVRINKVPLVKINAPIICDQQSECAFDFSGIQTDTTFYAANSANKILRSNDFSYTIFNIDGSSGLKFSGLIFEDDGLAVCPAGTICPPALIINKSNNITIEDSEFTNLQGTAVLVSDSITVIVNNSKFLNILKNGIEVTSVQLSGDIQIIDNIFTDVAGNALAYQSIGTNQNPSIIDSNTFTNNHSKGFYENCVYPCTGSQVKITGPTSKVEFRKNKISGGLNTIFDSLGLYPSGLEIGSTNINSVRIYCNEISGNPGSGVVQSSPVSSSSQIDIDGNKIWGNGLDMNTLTVNIGPDNCYNGQCNLECLKF